MAALGIERDACTGRGLDAAGFLGKARNWATQPQVNHGMGWYEVDDQTSLATDPFFVVSTHSGAYSNANLAKYIKFLLPTNTPGEIHITFYLSWHPSAHVGVEWSRWILRTLDSAGFAYDFRGGPEFAGIISRIGATADFCAWDTIDRDPDIVEANSVSGVLVNPAHLESGDTSNYLNNFHLITGHIPHLDTNGELHFSLVNTSGSNYRIEAFSDLARTVKIAETSPFLNTATGNKILGQVGGSGVGGQIGVPNPVAASTSIKCRFNRIDLGSGEGAAFTVNKFYYLYDFSAPISIGVIRYVKVIAKSGDQLVVDNIGPNPFAVGSIIRPMPHLWAAVGNNIRGGSPFLTQHYPYGSSAGLELPTGWSTNGPRSDMNWDGRVSRMNPDDEGNYTLSEISLVENTFSSVSATGGNRSYGYLKNFLMGSQTGVALFVDNRQDPTGKDYQYISNQNPYGLFMINSESSS